MIEVVNRMFSLNRERVFISWVFCLALIGCSALYRDVPMTEWLNIEFIIDSKVDVQLMVPPERAETEPLGPQFISTLSEPIQTLIFSYYDPGIGRDRDLLLTRITSTIFRIEQKPTGESGLSLEDVKNNIYLSRDDAKKHFDIVGEVTFNDHPWLRVNLISGYRRGISYATYIGREYVLVHRMSVYGDDADEKRLYRTRHATLRNIVNSTKITIE